MISTYIDNFVLIFFYITTAFSILVHSSLASTSTSTSTADSSSSSPSPEYVRKLVLAQCKARCLNQEGEIFPALDPVSKFLTNPSTCAGEKCQRCQKCLDSSAVYNHNSYNSTSSIGRHGHLAEFHAACFEEYQLPAACFHPNRLATSLDINFGTQASKDTMKLFESPKAIFHCSQKIGPGIFQAAFRFEYFNHTQILNKFSRMNTNLIPRVFLVEKLDVIPNKTSVISFITSNWTTILQIAESESIQLKITAVGVNIIYPPSYSDIIQLKDTPKRGRGGLPKDLQVVEIRKNFYSTAAGLGSRPAAPKSPMKSSFYEDEVEEEAQEMNVDYNSPSVTAAKKPIVQFEVLLHWNSGSGLDATCQYGIYALIDTMEKKERKTPEEAFWLVVDKNMTKSDITYGTEIELKVLEIPEVGTEENSTKINVDIPSCLEFEQGNFDLCDPPPVRNLHAELSPGNLLTINWEAPLYSNETNQIEEYRVTKTRQIKFYANGAWVHSPAELIKRVPGNITHLEQIVTGINASSSITIHVHAFAKGGISKAAQFTIHPIIPHPVSSIKEKLWTTIGTICLLLFLVLSFFGIKNFVEKLQRNKQRDQHFESLSMKEQSGGIISSSNGDLTMIYGPILGSRDKNYTSKWEIEFSCLTFGDSIGEGAFGVVRKAKLHKDGTSRLVAIKLLKLSNGVEVESKFWEEFDILKSLGAHENVIGLIGIVSVATCGPILVVEYCQGGDLRTFLREYAEYCINCPAITEKRTCRSKSNSGSLTNNNAVPAASGVNDQPPKPKCAPTVINETYFLDETSNKDKEIASGNNKQKIYKVTSITDLDILSYSRQIACGMEYLSSNKIVHRDLAARNILVSFAHGDHSHSRSHNNNHVQDRHVHNSCYDAEPRITMKIADFGLSRDIYEQNWYKKNSNGRIPIKWLPLECLLQEVYTTKSDVWSYGILLYEIVTFGGTPYPEYDNTKIFELLKEGYRMPKPKNCSEELYEIMQHCWQEKPTDRPDFICIKAKLDKIMESENMLNYFQVENNKEQFGQKSPAILKFEAEDLAPEMPVLERREESTIITPKPTPAEEKEINREASVLSAKYTNETTNDILGGSSSSNNALKPIPAMTIHTRPRALTMGS